MNQQLASFGVELGSTRVQSVVRFHKLHSSCQQKALQSAKMTYRGTENGGIYRDYS